MDRVSFSLVESLVWVGILCSIWMGLILFWRGKFWFRHHRSFFLVLLSGPILLILMGLGQGAFPLSMAPTAWRSPLSIYRNAAPLSYPNFQLRLRAHETDLLLNFTPSLYQSLTEKEIGVGCNYALDTVLSLMGLPPGRTVRNMKTMGPLTTLLGLSYGGPAFHDPFLGELAMVKESDHPSPKYWRLMAVCHEEAHAKGFTREMDAEILTQVALSQSKDIRYRLLGDIMYLRKSGERIHFPEYLRAEIRQSRDSLERVESRQKVVSLLRKISTKLGFQNSGGKYGSRDGSETWDPQHPFYTTVEDWIKYLPHNGNKNEPNH